VIPPKNDPWADIREGDQEAIDALRQRIEATCRTSETRDAAQRTSNKDIGSRFD
jgi:hypothetical protein